MSEPRPRPGDPPRPVVRAKDRKFLYGAFGLDDGQVRGLCANLVAALGFSVRDATIIEGATGLVHPVDCVGVSPRRKHVLVVHGGLSRPGGVLNRTEEDEWRRTTLLAGMDVRAAFESNGWRCDPILFRNLWSVRDVDVLASGELHSWLQKSALPFRFSSSSENSEPIEFLSRDELATSACQLGAGFISIEDLSVDELRSLTMGQGANVRRQAVSVLSRLRLRQFMRPPADELILVAAANGPLRRKDIPRIGEVATQLGHAPGANSIVTCTSYDDPIATALALKGERMIEYSAQTVRVTEDGMRIVQKIHKTSEESFIIRLLRSINLPGFAEAVGRAIRG